MNQKKNKKRKNIALFQGAAVIQ